MLLLHKTQLNAFEILGLKQFEDEMVTHINEYFPNHFFMMGEANVRLTIRYSYNNAKNYGFSSQRNVCLYINNSLILGSNFHSDPQYPWAKMILNDLSVEDPILRIDKLSDKVLDIFGEISGNRHVHLNRSLVNMHSNANEIFQNLKSANLESAQENLKEIFPKKFDVVGEVNLNNLIRAGGVNAKKYGIKSESNVLIYIVFMFLMGCGYDTDPQYSWAFKILSDENVNDENKKTKLLFDKAITNIGNFLEQYSKKP